MSATHVAQSNTTAAPVLYLALELSWNSWMLAFTVGLGQEARLRTIPARNTDVLLAEIRKAKARFGLPDETPVVACYEAGRDGFWLHRFLVHEGIDNRVVDSASIEVDRRTRRAKSDGLDATKLVEMLIRFHHGETKVWRVVRVPTVADEDRRQRHRELIDLKGQRTEHSNRIKGLLATFGLDAPVNAEFVGRLEGLRQWDGEPLPPSVTARILREFARWEQVDEQVQALSKEHRRAVRDDEEPQVEMVRQRPRTAPLRPPRPLGPFTGEARPPDSRDGPSASAAADCGPLPCGLAPRPTPGPSPITAKSLYPLQIATKPAAQQRRPARFGKFLEIFFSLLWIDLRQESPLILEALV